MSPLGLIILSAGVFIASGVLALFLLQSPRVASLLAVLGAVVGAALGLCGTVLVLRTGLEGQVSVPWAIPGGSFSLGVDPLSAFFLVPLFVLGGLCALYGRGYLGPRGLPAVAFNLLLAMTVLILIARNATLFLIAWEAMTLLTFLLVTLDHQEIEARRAGWVYLIASHITMIALILGFLALGASAAGSLDFASFSRSEPVATFAVLGIQILSLIGFGIKAGIAGMHVWLPEAHGAAPSHVSAFMSAVLIKLGVYGILRTALLLPPQPWLGIVLMILGLTGALYGIVLALGQRDLKRILAYSSVENMGIILLGFGLGFWALGCGDARLAALAFAGALLHVWNHAAMKGLLFLGAGSILHATGTKDIERLGGLLPRMPLTGPAMILGAAALSGLPPLNGFTGEWLLLRGLADVGIGQQAPASLAAMAGASVLALTGGLAALCFLRLLGVTLLGSPRAEGAAHAYESPVAMTFALLVLGAGCVAGGLFAPALLSSQVWVLAELLGSKGTDVSAAARFLSPLSLVHLVLVLLLAIGLAWLLRRTRCARADETWGCGYAAPGPRMQYTGRSFAEFLNARALPRWIRPSLRLQPPKGLFPSAADFAGGGDDPMMHGIYEPFLVHTGNRFSRLRFLQRGKLHVYLLYLLAALMGGLLWVAVRHGVER